MHIHMYAYIKAYLQTYTYIQKVIYFMGILQIAVQSTLRTIKNVGIKNFRVNHENKIGILNDIINDMIFKNR